MENFAKTETETAACPECEGKGKVQIPAKVRRETRYEYIEVPAPCLSCRGAGTVEIESKVPPAG